MNDLSSEQLNAAETENIQEAVLKYANPRRIRRFDVKFFETLHQEMFGSVHEDVGRISENLHQDLISLEQDLATWPHELESGVKLHHRAAQIRPFHKGNGRWARLLSNLWMQKYVGVSVRWPDSLDETYLAALRAADQLNYEPLLDLHKTYLHREKAYYLPPR